MILRTIDSVIQMLDADLIEGGDLDAVISGVSTDSRSCGRGSLFIPLVGERFDGHDYAAQAIAQGISDEGGLFVPILTIPMAYR